MGNISIQYPVWFIILCLLLGVGYAAALYFKDRTFRDQSKQLNWILGALRFLAVSLLAFFLLDPVLKSVVTEVKKPVIVLAQDVSESVGSGIKAKDSLAYHKAFDALANALDNDYEVHRYAFGDAVREGVDFQYKDKISNISELIKSAYDLYSNQNLGAVIMATDGVYNEGSNPLYNSTKLNAPVFSIALGDTTPKKDLILKRVFNNNIAYLGDKFKIQIDVSAQNCSGANSTLSISKIQGNVVSSIQQIPVSINKNDFFLTKEITLDANQAGVQRYRIALSSVTGEVTTINNVKDVFIDVLDARQKILILANSPHPDIAAINQVIGTNKNYSVSTAYANDIKVNVAEYDFVILHQLPSKTYGIESVLNNLNAKRIPRLFIVGTQTDLNRFNTAQSLVNISGDGKNLNDVQASISGNFNLFTIDQALSNGLPNFNPLTAPFGDFRENGGAQTLIYQRIGKVDTKYPLLSFNDQNGIKTGVLCAEGIWKWRLFDFLQNKNHDITDELISKTIQYLAVKEDKRKFRVSIDKNIFNENEPVQFGAELYNDSYELINDPDASMSIKNSEGKEFSFTFNKTEKAYALDAGILPVGDYNYKATTNYNKQNLTFSGQFTVQSIQLELFETTANHALLRQLSEQSGGAMVYPQNMAKIAEMIKSKEKIRPVMYTTNKTNSLINLKWLFFLIMGLLSLEWFARRYYGGY